MFITSNTSETIACRVSPESKDYGIQYPIYVFYNDGSWSRQQGWSLQDGEYNYFRSKANVMIKPRCELTINDIADILENSVVNHIRKAG